MARAFTFVLLAVLMVSMAPAFAAQDDEATNTGRVVLTAAGPIELFPQPVTRAAVTANPKRPMALLPLYLTLGALNAADVYTTTAALHAGAREANPLMRPVVGNQKTFFAVKTATTLGTVVAVERMWKHGNRAGAIATLVAVNGVTAAVAAHNARNARAGR